MWALAGDVWSFLHRFTLGAGDVVGLTHEFLAHMLGTRRASVTVAAAVLQKAGLLTYTRGAVKIKNRTRLMSATCECYGAINRQSEMWESEST